MNTKEFISKKNIGNLYKIINKDHKYGKSKDRKKKVIDKLITNMKKVYKSLDQTKINNRNYQNIFDQFNKIAIDETLKSLDNKMDINNNKFRRDFKSTPKREVKVMSRPAFTKHQNETRTRRPTNDKSGYKIPKNQFGAINSNNINGNIDNERTMIDSMFQPMRQPQDNEKLFNNMSMDKNQSQMNDMIKQLESERKFENKNTRPSTPDFLKATKVTSDRPKELNVPTQNNNMMQRQIPEQTVNKNTGYQEMGTLDDGSYSSLNSVNISMAPKKEFVDNNASFEDRLKQLQSERNVNINIEKTSENDFTKQMEMKNGSISNNTNLINEEQMIEPMQRTYQEEVQMQPRYEEERISTTPDISDENVMKYNTELGNQNLEYVKMINELQSKVRNLEEENLKLNKSTSYVEELIKNVTNLKKENESLRESKQISNLNNSILNQRENSIIDRENQVRKLLDIYHQINNKKYIQLDIFSDNSSEYIYEFDNIKGIIGIKLMSYSLPKPRFNITSKNNLFKYTINDVDKEINIPIGYYTIEQLISFLNESEDFTIENNNHKLILKAEEDIDLESSFLVVNNLGFQKNTYGKEIKANKSWDLRLPDKLFLFINNINESIPIGILYFNEIFSSEILLEEPIDLNNFEIKLTDEDGELFDFTDLHHSLSFKLEVIMSEDSGGEIDAST